MATARIMYWKEVPVQIQASGDGGRVSRPLDDRFQVGADAIAMFDGSQDTDAYLDGWIWGEPFNVAGTAEEVATSLADRFNRQFPLDFVARIRRLHEAGTRNPTPGAVDHWMEEVP